MALSDTAALVASLTLKDQFSGPATGIHRSLDNLDRKATTTFGRIGSEAQRGLGVAAGHIQRLGTIAAGFAVTGLLISIRAASDLNEEIDKSAVVFGAAATRVQEFSTNAATIGLAKAEALGAAGAFGNMFNTIGFAQDESADMSITMVQLAADMASFNNEDPTAMLDRLRSGLSGEAEPLRRFGVLLSEAAVTEEAYATGIVASGEALTEAQKVQARYSLILRQTAIQQGNYAQTSSSLANQQRTLRANLINTASTIGTALLPKLAEFTGKLSDFVTENQPAIQAFADQLPAAFDKLVEFGGNLPWAAIGDAFRLMGAGSKAFLDAFINLPPEAQATILALASLNKLTGGAVGSIVSTLASGLIKGILGITAAVVNINAGTVTGGPAGGAPVGGGGSKGGNPLGLLTGLLGPGALGLAIGEATGGAMGIIPDVQVIKLAAALKAGAPTIEEGDLAGITREAMIQALNDPNFVAGLRGNQEEQLRELVGLADVVPLTRQGIQNGIRDREQERQALANLRGVAERSDAARRSEAMRSFGIQERIANKPTTFTSNVSTTVNIDGRRVAAIITKKQMAVGSGFQPFFE